MLSLHSPTACGGIGVGIIHMAPAGDSVGGGVRRGTTIAGTIPVIGVAATGVAIGATIITTTIIIIRIIPVTVGAAATGVAGMAADIGDIITIGMVVLAGAGVVEAIGHATLIRVAVHMLLVDIVLLLLVVQIMVVRKYVGLLAYLLEVVSQRGE